MVSSSSREFFVRDEFDIMQVYDVKVVGMQAPKTARDTAFDSFRGIIEFGRIAADFSDLHALLLTLLSPLHEDTYQRIRITREFTPQSTKSVPEDDLGIPIKWRSIEYIHTIAVSFSEIYAMPSSKPPTAEPVWQPVMVLLRRYDRLRYRCGKT